jgi:hypothetical protein
MNNGTKGKVDGFSARYLPKIFYYQQKKGFALCYPRAGGDPSFQSLSWNQCKKRLAHRSGKSD